MHAGRRLRWELKYVAFPYGEWTREEFDDEDRARSEFRRRSEQMPAVVNLSLRSRWTSADPD